MNIYGKYYKAECDVILQNTTNLEIFLHTSLQLMHDP